MIQQITQIFQNYQAKPLGNVKEYATILPLIEINGQWHILYEVRGKFISHPSDTSFPGGKIELGETPQEAAIREAYEEIGVDPQAIDIIGELDYIVRDFRVVYCYVAVIRSYDFAHFQESDEVSRIFTVPLDYLLDKKPKFFPIHITENLADHFPFEQIFPKQNYHQRQRDIEIPVYQLRPLVNENLWGLTAQLTHRFIEIIRQEGLTQQLTSK